MANEALANLELDRAVTIDVLDGAALFTFKLRRMEAMGEMVIVQATGRSSLQQPLEQQIAEARRAAAVLLETAAEVLRRGA